MASWRQALERNWKRNWMYMVAGTVLSVLVWIAVSADALTQDIIPADLVIVNADRRYILVSREPDTDLVDVRFSGRAGELVALSVARPRIVVSIDSVRSLVQEIELDPNMVQGPGARQLTDVRALSVHPESFRLHFAPRAQRVVRVVPQVRVSLASGYTMADSVRVEPGSVAVEGPEAAVSRIDSVTTLPLVRERLEETLTAEVPLQQPDARGVLELSVTSARVTVPVEVRGERIFSGVPVEVTGGTNAWRVDPPQVDVRLSGPRSAVEAVKLEEIQPTVEVSGFADVGKRVPISIEPPAPFLRVLLEPDSARALPVQDGS